MKAKRTALLGRVYLIICLIVALFPIYWMINTSFKSDSEIYAKVPTLIPHHPTGAAYSYLINNTNFLSSMKNSLIIAVSVSVFSILIAYPVAYTLSRLKFKEDEFFKVRAIHVFAANYSFIYSVIYAGIENASYKYNLGINCNLSNVYFTLCSLDSDSTYCSGSKRTGRSGQGRWLFQNRNDV